MSFGRGASCFGIFKNKGWQCGSSVGGGENGGL